MAPGSSVEPERGRSAGRVFIERLGLWPLRPAWAWWPTAAGLIGAALAGAGRETMMWALPEELLFRGAIQGELASRLPRPWQAAVLSAASFALAHTVRGGASGLLTFLPGLLFGALRQVTGSIWPAVAAHALANLIWVWAG